MKLLLSDPPFDPRFRLRHQHNLFFLGSCFAEEMATYFTDRKFTIRQNPFGILFNPVSIATCIRQIVRQESYDSTGFYEQHGLYASWDHHSNLGGDDPLELKQKLEDINRDVKAYLEQTNVVFITLGSAWVYWHTERKEVVANNLKAPINLFERRLLDIGEIATALKEAIVNLREVRSDINIVFTVSPVRYSKQGLIESNRSKARLLEAVHQVCDEDNNLTYFPSYEIVIDVLRDYRFFGKDFVHPNQLATDYLWEFILEHFIHIEDKTVLEAIYKIKRARQHNLQNPRSTLGKQFISKQLETITRLEQRYSYLDFNEEKSYFENL